MPKIVDKQEKSNSILDAAIRVFAKQGVKNTKIADIAEAAQIGKGTVYEYFNSKHDIFAATFEFFMKKIEGVIIQRLDHIQDPLERLKVYFDAWGNILENENLDYMEVLLDFWAEGIRSKRDVHTFGLIDIYKDYRKTIEDLLKECINLGLIKQVKTNIAASILLGTVDGLLLQWIVDRSVFNIQDAINLSARIYIDGLLKK